jgi:hypothetical protein
MHSLGFQLWSIQACEAGSMTLSRKVSPEQNVAFNVKFLVTVCVVPISIIHSTLITVDYSYHGTGIFSGYSRKPFERNAGIKAIFREYFHLFLSRTTCEHLLFTQSATGTGHFGQEISTKAHSSTAVRHPSPATVNTTQASKVYPAAR